MDILRQLSDLENMIEGPWSLGPLTWGLNRDEIVMQISKIRASLPQELKNAASTMRESDRILEEARADATGILENARKEAERIVAESRTESERMINESRVHQERVLAESKLQQERMVSESEILKLSKVQSEEIRAGADRDALSMRRGAEKYSYDVLTQMEVVLGKAMTAIERGKSEIAPENKAPANPVREKARV